MDWFIPLPQLECLRFWVRKIRRDFAGVGMVGPPFVSVTVFCGEKWMSVLLNLLFLLIAIVLEVCGDASIRIGLRSGRPLLFSFGAALVICYGMTISLPNWNFGRTMGVYIAMFFVVSQIVAHVTLKENLTLPTIVGGTLIIGGGLIILFWRPA